LDQNAVIALRLDQGFGNAKFIHPLAQNFDGVRERVFGVRSLGQLVGIHADEEGSAALQVETQANATGGLALQAVENVRGRVQLLFGPE